MDCSENINELAASLAKAQSEMTFAVKDSDNAFFKSRYADLSSVIEAIRGPLTKNGLCFLQPIVRVEGSDYLETILIHTSGQWVKSTVPVYINKNAKNMMQEFGSTISYLRRYSLSALVGITQDDDDGNTAKYEADDAKNNASKKTTPPPKPNKINPIDIEFFETQLEFYGNPIKSRFYKTLTDNRVDGIRDMPESWVQRSKTYLQELISEYEGGGDE